MAIAAMARIPPSHGTNLRAPLAIVAGAATAGELPDVVPGTTTDSADTADPEATAPEATADAEPEFAAALVEGPEPAAAPEDRDDACGPAGSCASSGITPLNALGFDPDSTSRFSRSKSVRISAADWYRKF